MRQQPTQALAERPFSLDSTPTMKPSAERLLLSHYPHTLEVPARFSDLDPLNHLNNVAIGNFYEEGRSAFNRRAFRQVRDRSGIRMLMVNVSITYLREGRYPGTLTVATGLLRLGVSSFCLGQALFQNDLCIGVAESTTVNIRNGASAPLPEEFRIALEQGRLNPALPDGARQQMGAEA
jgi:acyl-CoA thioester hydrolase